MKTIKLIIYAIMFCMTLSILSFNTRECVIDSDPNKWVLFGLINLLYWGGKFLKCGVSLLLNWDYDEEAKIERSRNTFDLSQRREVHNKIYKTTSPPKTNNDTNETLTDLCNKMKLNTDIKSITIITKTNSDKENEQPTLF